MKTLSRVAGRIFGEPLAIDRGKADIIASAVGPRLFGAPRAFMDDDDDEGASAPSGPGYTVDSNGLATIGIYGTLVSRASGMDALSGLSTYAAIRASFEAAIADSNVAGVLLACDSPGGEVTGMFELADAIYQARGQKPICAAVDCAASACYMLASSADCVIVSQVGLVGSIGVIALHLDQSGADAKAGLKYTAIYAGDRKNDGNPHEPLTDAAHAEIQARVDEISDIFAAAVSRNRGMSPADVKSAQAALFMGKHGVAAGFADAVGPVDMARRVVTAAVRNGNKSIYATDVALAANSKENPMPDPNAAPQPTAAEIESLIANARTEGYADAAQTVDLCIIAGQPSMIARFIGEKKPIAGVRADLLAARHAASNQNLDTSIMPGADAAGKEAPPAKAAPWKTVLGALGILRKGE